MKRWTFEPGHTAAEFSVRHMMITWVRGHFKDVKGSLEFDPAAPERSKLQVVIDVATLWSGEPQRDAHLKSADFLDLEHHPQITFESERIELLSPVEAKVKTRAGFVATGRLNRYDFGVSWNSPLDRGGIVVGSDVEFTLDAEAILEA